MAFLQLGEDIVGDGLVDLRTVLDGQAFDRAELDLAGSDLFLEEVPEDALGLLGDVGTDAVAAADADDDRRECRVVGPLLVLLHRLDALQLFFEEAAEVLLGLLDGFIRHRAHHHSKGGALATQDTEGTEGH